MNQGPPDRAVTYRGVVYPWHCDHMGHMNVMWYVGKFDEATWNLLAAIGITPAYIRAQKHGMAAVQQNIAYKKELTAGDIVVVRSKILEVRDKVIRFQHELMKDETDELAAICELTGVHMDLRTRKSRSLPPQIAARARSLVRVCSE
jgi:acyl-CoA thioester hydrolase